MKRSAIKRKTPLRATGSAGAVPDRHRRRSAYRTRDRDVDYMLWIKQQTCCARGLSRCYGPIEADHAGRRAMGRKADDRTCIPLCMQHHTQRGSFSGPFRTWNQAMMRVWLEGHILVYQGKHERMTMTAQAQVQVDKKFFKFDDGGSLYFAVARDAAHAKNMLMDAGIEWGDPSTKTPPDPLEIAADRASQIRCDVSDAPGEEPDTKRQLSECSLGDWFSTEY